MAQGKKSREKKNVNDLEKGEQIVYKTKDGEEIPCLVLYDNEYNEKNGKDYGVQVMSLTPVCDVLLGINDPEIPSSMASQNAWERGTWSYNNSIVKLNSQAELYRNPQYTNEGGARCLGTIPNNPSASNGDKTDLNRIQELAKEGLIPANKDVKVWYAIKENYSTVPNYNQFNGIYLLEFGRRNSYIRTYLSCR